MTEPNPHLWRPYAGPEDHEEICDRCDAFPNTPAGEAPCVEVLPDDPFVPPEGWENWPTGGAGSAPVLIEGDMTEWVANLWQLIFADDPGEIARLEAVAGATQSEAVDTFIDHSCWGRDVPALVGGKGTAAERRAALCAAYLAFQARAGAPVLDP
jgi:hypothetical protein